MQKDYSEELIATANKICTPGKGILAADESPTSVSKKFDALKVENNAENRRKYREMLITSPGIEQYISGVILQEETAGQGNKEGVTFIKYLQDRGIVPGIKVNLGLFRWIRELQPWRATPMTRVILKDWQSYLRWQRSSMS